MADHAQGRGLGWILLRALAMVGADHGFARFEMTMLASNEAMIRLSRKAWATLERPSRGTVRASLSLEPRLWNELDHGQQLRRLALQAAYAA